MLGEQRVEYEAKVEELEQLHQQKKVSTLVSVCVFMSISSVCISPLFLLILV